MNYFQNTIFISFKSDDNEESIEETSPQGIADNDVKPTTKRRGRPPKTVTARKPRAKKVSSREETVCTLIVNYYYILFSNCISLKSDEDGSVSLEVSSQDSADDDDFKPTTKRRPHPKRTVPARRKRVCRNTLEPLLMDTPYKEKKPPYNGQV